jgi:hypothetical protein
MISDRIELPEKVINDICRVHTSSAYYLLGPGILSNFSFKKTPTLNNVLCLSMEGEIFGLFKGVAAPKQVENGKQGWGRITQPSLAIRETSPKAFSFFNCPPERAKFWFCLVLTASAREKKQNDFLATSVL